MVFERNPKSFESLEEPTLRDHILVQLNGHCQGAATGETFNGRGKTDILVRVRNRNLLIAECKFWTGPKNLDKAIAQLLGYLTWRDAKAALLVFNRKRGSTRVARKMHQVMTRRSEHRRTLEPSKDGGYRYVFACPSDPSNELVITTLLFDVPAD
jgi:hypothetical protein